MSLFIRKYYKLHPAPRVSPQSIAIYTICYCICLFVDVNTYYTRFVGNLNMGGKPLRCICIKK